MDVPGAWYSILPELDFELPPDSPPPGGPASAAHTPALTEQEAGGKQWFGIPHEVLSRYRQWRPTPLRRARGLERVLGTRCRIYYKYEGGNLSGSHRLNTAVAQAYYYRRAGARRLTAGTAAGHWGTAVAVACAMFGLECQVFMDRSGYLAQPDRKTIMELLGATVIASPSPLAEAALEAEDPEVFFAGGRAETYSLLHQTVIGLETRQQLLALGEQPDVLVGALGGGGSLGGLVLPFLGAARCGGPPVRCLSAFAPPGLHTGGPGQHGTAKLIGALYRHGMIEVAAYPQRGVFGSALLFAEAEGILPAPESGYAIHGAVMEAQRADQSHRSECIAVVVGGHGLADLTAHRSYRDGSMADVSATGEQMAAALAALPPQPDAGRLRPRSLRPSGLRRTTP